MGLRYHSSQLIPCILDPEVRSLSIPLSTARVDSLPSLAANTSMASDQTMMKAFRHIINDLIPSLPNSYFDPSCDNGEARIFAVDNHSFTFSRYMTSSPGQVPSHIAFVLGLDSEYEWKVYVTNPSGTNFARNRRALLAGYNILSQTKALVMHQIDANTV